MAGPHDHDKKPETKQKSAQDAKAEAAAAKEAYAEEMRKKGATLPKGFIKDAKANTGH